MIDRPVRVGLQLQPQHMEYSAIRETVAEAEELGVDLLYNWDHFYPLYGEPDGLHFECWSMLAAWAEQTSRVEIGALVSCNSYRNPDLLADMARTIDHISTGRLILGIGAGWFQRDYDEYGYEFGTPGTRLDALAEALPRIEERWGRLNPAPTRKIPVMIGGGGEKKTLRMVAKHADIWNTLAKGDELAHKIDVLKGHCDTIGRDPSEIEISAGIGDAGPAEVAEPYHDLGVRQFICSQGGPKPDLGPLREWLTWRDRKNA
jgi:probable F420-dependent oxidoreductase